MITPHLCKAARALLEWTQADLAEKAGVPIDTVSRFEQGKSDTRGKAMIAMEKAIRHAGIKLLQPEHGEGEGLRYAKAKG